MSSIDAIFLGMVLQLRFAKYVPVRRSNAVDLGMIPKMNCVARNDS